MDRKALTNLLFNTLLLLGSILMVIWGTGTGLASSTVRTLPGVPAQGTYLTPDQPGVDPFQLFLPVVKAERGPLKALGVYIPLTNHQTWAAEVNQFVDLTGKAHAIYLVASGFECPWVDEIADIEIQLDAIRAQDAIPLISWLPFNCQADGFGDVNALGLPDILDGSWDNYMRQWATDVAALDYPVVVRWGHEMNIPSYSWSAQHAFGRDGRSAYDEVEDACELKGCYGDPGLYDGPERYLAAYRHVHNLVAPLALNIIWLWNPNNVSYPPLNWNDPADYYPGDAYVDWVGLDGYNWGERSGNGSGFTWASFDFLFGAALADLAERYPDKPQIVAEFGSVEDEIDPYRKAAWLIDAYNSARLNYPNLIAICYTHDGHFWDASHAPPQFASFQLDSSPQSLVAYQQAIQTWSASPP